MFFFCIVYRFLAIFASLFGSPFLLLLDTLDWKEKPNGYTIVNVIYIQYTFMHMYKYEKKKL